MLWSVIRLIFKTSSVTPDFFYAFNLVLSFGTCSQSFKKICTWELLGANVLNAQWSEKLVTIQTCYVNSYLANTSSNQRLGVRSVVPVKLRVRCWTHYLYVNGWSSDITYWQSPLLFCGLFDFFAVWLASDVSPAAGELRFDDLWWHVAWRF